MFAVQFRHGWEPALIASVLAALVVGCKAVRNRKLLVALAMLLPSAARAAYLPISTTLPADPENFLAITISGNQGGPLLAHHDVGEMGQEPWTPLPDAAFWMPRANPGFILQDWADPPGLDARRITSGHNMVPELIAGATEVEIALGAIDRGTQHANYISDVGTRAVELHVGILAPEPQGWIVAACGAVMGWAGIVRRGRP